VSVIADSDSCSLHVDVDRLYVHRQDGGRIGQVLMDAHHEQLGRHVDEHRVEVVVLSGDYDLRLVGVDMLHGCSQSTKLASSQRWSRSDSVLRCGSVLM
jgi:hypothetical protein